MLFKETIRVPADRVGVIVGKDGKVRRRIEQLTNVHLDIDSHGLVTITNPTESDDPILAWKARDIVRAIGRGFSPKNALTLVDEDMILLIISLREAIGTSPNQLKRIAGRIIGERGRTRRAIEQITATKICIYGHTISIIGMNPGLDYARRAIDMLISGAPHSAVYSHLERMRRDMNLQEAELWEKTDL
jgi:ribosomal RNA assembly protein